MDNKEDKLKGLPCGAVISAVFEPEIGTLNVIAVYSPGVRLPSGTLEQFVRWCIALVKCPGGETVFSALAFKPCGDRGQENLHLKSLCGSSDLFALEKPHLLEGLGLAGSEVLANHYGWEELQTHVHQVRNLFSDLTTARCFFDQQLARRCAAERAKLYWPRKS